MNHKGKRAEAVDLSIPPEQQPTEHDIHRARLVVADRATDPEDRRTLLSMLGLDS